MNSLLTPELIRRLLSCDRGIDVSSDYVRLMELYCVVRAGGAAAQIEAARHLETLEKSALLQDIERFAENAEAESRIRALQHEIKELERATANRIRYLRDIDPHEEASVRSCLPDIDAHFKHMQHSHQSSTYR